MCKTLHVSVINKYDKIHTSYASFSIVPGFEIQPYEVLLFEGCQNQRNPVDLFSGSFEPLGLQDPKERVQAFHDLRL